MTPASNSSITGQRPIILVGDGAFQMTGWELGNARRIGCDPIVLVFNNASWEMLRTFQPESSFNDLSHWGFAEMASGMGGDGVRVNTVSPGTTYTEIHADGGRPNAPEERAARMPMGRAAYPDEVAAAVAYLLSPDASYTNGADIRITGG